jgi:hydrogenase maturation protease
MTARDDILLIGIGNEFRGDDELGLHLARKVRALAHPGVVVKEESGEGAALMEAWRGHDNVILIDAISSGSTPGLIHCIDASVATVPKELFCFSSHAFGVAAAIELSRKLGHLPEKTVLFGIEGKTFKQGARMSRIVRARSKDLLEAIMLWIKELRLSSWGTHTVDPLSQSIIHQWWKG